MNVWLLVFTNVNTERVLGPFTAIVIDTDTIVDPLAGELIASRSEFDKVWLLHTFSRGEVIVARRIVVQQGGFEESPWGERGGWTRRA